MKHIAYVGIAHLKHLLGEDLSHIDTFNLAFGHIEDSVVCIKRKEELSLLSHIQRENPHCRFVLSIGGWSADGFSQSTRTNTLREELASQMAAIVEQYNLDGIDLDWEYPGYSIAGIESHPMDGENYADLLAKLRGKLPSPKLLTIAVGGDSYYIRAVPMKEVAIHVDYVQIMSYDLRGGFTNVTGHHTNLYTPTCDLSPASGDQGVQDYQAAGVPKEKLVLGIASYSRMWTGVPNRYQGYGQHATSFGGYGPTYEDLLENNIGKDGFIRYWDDEAKAPYLFNGETFISYDDPESVTHKLEYAQKRGLCGVMVWEVLSHPNGAILGTLKAYRER